MRVNANVLPPLFDFSALPEQERPHAQIAFQQLFEMRSLADWFAAALTLFVAASTDLHKLGPDGIASETARRLRSWKLIAARDGSMTLYHFLRALQSIKRCLDRSPAMRAIVPTSEIESALKDFWTYFPGAKKARDSVGHTAELLSSPERWAANALKDDYIVDGNHIISKGSAMRNSLFNNTFTTTTFGGDMVTYDVTDETLKRLHLIIDRVHAAFDQSKRQPPAVP